MDDFVNKAVIPVEAIDVDVQVHPNDKLEEARAYSASNGHAILNSQELPLKTKTEPHSYAFPSQELTLNGRLCRLSTDPARAKHWSTNTLAMFLSIKNRNFSKRFVKWFVDLCEAGGHKGLIVPVDEPYVYNRQAELEVDELCEDERGRIFRLASDITRMVQKVLRGAGATHVELATWQDLAKVTPGWMTEEITAAYRFPGEFRDVIKSLVSSTKGSLSLDQVDRYAEFLLCEIPVLLEAYYGSPKGVTDFYPGPNPEVFWMIEAGVFASEMPRTTAYVRAGNPLIYMDVSVEPKNA